MISEKTPAQASGSHRLHYLAWTRAVNLSTTTALSMLCGLAADSSQQLLATLAVATQQAYFLSSAQEAVQYIQSGDSLCEHRQHESII